jgi:hypothetical protein
MSSMIKTKASMIQSKDSADFKHIKFEKKSLKTLPKTAPPKIDDEKAEESDDSEFERIFGDGPKKPPKKNKKELTFESARREIINFGIAGSNVTVKSDLSQQLAIKLGAKPGKKQGRNYKEILEEKRREKNVEKVDQRKISGSYASHQFRSQKLKGRKAASDGLLKNYGRVEKKTVKKNFRK